MFRFLALIIVLTTLMPWPVGAQTPHKAKGRPTIGLVLGGGGAKGLAHVGVIRALEENHIPVDVISGTSMGAIVGSLYASGYSADELENIVNEMDWHDVFNDKTSRSRATFRRKADEFGFLTDYKITFKDGKIVLPRGIIQGQNLFLELSRLLATTRSIGRFDDLPIPFRLVATDLGTGKAVVMKDGDLATAVFASMAIPGLVPPVEREGHYLIDGGLVDNVPVDLARAMGADIVIVVNVGTEPKKPEEIGNFIDVLRQTQILLTEDNTRKQLASLGPDDIRIEPDLKGLSAASFSAAPELSKRGFEAAQAILPKLTKLQLNDKDWQKHLMGRLRVPQNRPVISKITISQNSRLSDDVMRVGLHLKPGEVFDPEKLNQDIDKLYGMGIYDRITYRLEDDHGRTVLHLNGKVKDSSDGFYKFGIQLDSNLENSSAFQFGVSYTKPMLNKWGGEWRSEINFGDRLQAVSEFYQPLGPRQRLFVEPSVFLNRVKDDYFDLSDRRRGTIKALQLGGSLQGGLLFGRWGELRAGLSKSRVRLSFSDTTLGISPLNIDDSFLMARFSIDTLDSLSFPTKGGLLIADYELHDTFLGGETQYNQSSLNAFKPFTFGRHTFGLGTRLSGAAGRDANLLGTSNLGGFLAVSGFAQDELSGQYGAMMLGTYYYRLNRQSPLFDLPLYIGGSLEAGNVYQSFDSISLDQAIYASSLFAGMKSPLGPVFVGIGYNDKGHTSLYFSIGSFF